ncbi:MAG: hypothetical protein ACRDPO_16425 [Streptosporangiaceae bacterium]
MQAAVQETEAVRILVVFAAISIVAFWRTVIRCLVVLATTVVIATLGFGAITIWHSMNHIAR